MTLEQWAYVAEIIGAVVIFASLVYVAMQVRQNTKAQFAASRQDRTTWESYLAPTAVFFDSELARRIWASKVIRLDAGFRAQIDNLIGSPRTTQ